MMEAKLICYTLGKTSNIKRSKLKRELFGYKDKSNNSRYQYQRNGILTHIPNIRPIRSVIITKCEDSIKVQKILQKYGAKISIFDVSLKESL